MINTGYLKYRKLRINAGSRISSRAIYTLSDMDISDLRIVGCFVLKYVF